MLSPAVHSLTVVQGIDIACPADRALDFMQDAPQWLPWALPGVESVLPLPFGQWLVKTATYLAKLRPVYYPGRGAVDYEMVCPSKGSWRVPIRIVPIPSGCHFAVTFTKPTSLPLPTFEARVQYAADGLHTLKLLLEQD